MSRFEQAFNPFSAEQRDDIRRLGRWLYASCAYYDTSDNSGYTTRLLLEDHRARGTWVVPLLQPVDLAGSGIQTWKERFISTRVRPNIWVDNTCETATLKATPGFDSEDGSDHSSPIDIDAMTFKPTQLMVISPLLNDVEVVTVEDFRGDNLGSVGND